MAREQVDPLRQPTLTPVASPVNRYARTDAGQQLGQLADALKGLAPELAQFSGTMATQIRSRDTEEGKRHADKLFAEVQETGKQIKAGEIAPSESKWFRMAANEQLGRLHSGRFKSQVTSLLADPNGPLANSTDPADFDAAVGAAREQYVGSLGEQDASFMSGFNDLANNDVNAARNSFAAMAGDRLEKQVIEATYQEHQTQIEGQWRGPESAAAIAQAIYERNTIQYALNPKSGAQLSNTMIRAVIDTAIKNEDVGMLEILKHIPGGGGNGKLANTTLANKLVPEAIKEIRGMRQQRYNLQNTEDASETELAVEGVLGKLYAAMDEAHKAGASMTTVNPQQYAEEIAKTDPTKAASIYRAYEAYKNRVNVDDEATLFDLVKQSNRDSLTYDAIADAFESKLITWESARKLQTDIEKKKAGRSKKFLTEDPRLSKSVSRLFQRFIDQYGVNAPGVKTRAEFAVQELETMWIDWREGAGKDASERDVNNWLHNAHNTLFFRRADVDLREASLEGVDLPAAGTVGPQLVNWEKGQVIEPHEIANLQSELTSFLSKPKYQFSARAEYVFHQNGLTNAAEIEAFLARQKQFIPLTQR